MRILYVSVCDSWMRMLVRSGSKIEPLTRQVLHQFRSAWCLWEKLTPLVYSMIFKWFVIASANHHCACIECTFTMEWRKGTKGCDVHFHFTHIYRTRMRQQQQQQLHYKTKAQFIVVKRVQTPTTTSN